MRSWLILRKLSLSRCFWRGKSLDPSNPFHSNLEEWQMITNVRRFCEVFCFALRCLWHKSQHGTPLKMNSYIEFQPTSSSPSGSNGSGSFEQFSNHFGMIDTSQTIHCESASPGCTSKLLESQYVWNAFWGPKTQGSEIKISEWLSPGFCIIKTCRYPFFWTILSTFGYKRVINYLLWSLLYTNK